MRLNARPESQARYRERTARGQCPACPAVASAGSVYCDACVARRRPASRRRAQAAAEVRRLASGPNLLGCCGTWHAVTHLPLRVACCGRVYFAEVRHGTALDDR